MGEGTYSDVLWQSVTSIRTNPHYIMAPEARDRVVLLPEMTKLHRAEQSKVAHQNVSRAERAHSPTTLLWRAEEKEAGWGIFFLSSSSYILKIHVIDVQFTSQDCKSGVESPVGRGVGEHISSTKLLLSSPGNQIQATMCWMSEISLI
jgi:hypothetical protein